MTHMKDKQQDQTQQPQRDTSMQILVDENNFNEVLGGLIPLDLLSLDTETYGLDYNDRMFSIQIGTETDEFYFNFLRYEDTSIPILNATHLSDLRDLLFHDDRKVWLIHNAKFDLHRLFLEEINLSGDIWCTELNEHFVRNNYDSYSLEACLERIGMKKDDKVREWLDTPKNKGYTVVRIPGKKNRKKNYHYDRVPFDIMFTYGCMDVRGCYDLGVSQMEVTEEKQAQENLSDLIRAVHRMENNGMKINVEYCKEAMDYENRVTLELRDSLSRQAGETYKGGPKWLASTLDRHGVQYGTTDTGRPCFNKNAITDIKHHITDTLLEMRGHEKNANSFYSTYLFMADNGGILHPNYRIEGTDTGRFSCTNPNLQQVPKETDDVPYPVRRSFIPREGFIYTMIDYDQMEYRLLADYAGEKGMIEAIMGGLDPHTFTARELEIERKQAKTVNFAILYGVGINKLSGMLGVSAARAREIRNTYFRKLPMIKELVQNISQAYESRGHIFNRFGRRYFLNNSSHVYKLPNHLIQGTGADIVKLALVKIDNLLEGYKSMLVAQVHDELLLEIHETELHLIPQIKEIMENVYPAFNGMKLTCGLEWSAQSWHDKREGMPTIQEIKEWNQSLLSAGKKLPQELTESISQSCLSI